MGDFALNAEATKEKLLEKETLRRTVLSHPKLHGVKMDWAFGLVLATRVMDNSRL